MIGKTPGLLAFRIATSALVLGMFVSCHGRQAPLANTSPAGVPKDFHIAVSQVRDPGARPVFDLDINHEGAVVYRGYRYVATKGVQVYSISPPAVARLVDEVEHASFFERVGNYKRDTIDVSTTTISVRMSGRQHRVDLKWIGDVDMLHPMVEDRGAYGVLQALANDIVEIAEASRFIKGDGSAAR